MVGDTGITYTLIVAESALGLENSMKLLVNHFHFHLASLSSLLKGLESQVG